MRAIAASLAGHAVRHIALRQATRFRLLQAEGFYEFEAEDDFRWTNGDALPPEALFADFNGSMQLVLHVGWPNAQAKFGLDKELKKSR